MFPPRAVSDQEILQHVPLVESLARKYNYPKVEYDDIRQEGLIAVWNDLRFDNTPTKGSIVAGMRAWIRHSYREGMGGYDDVLPTGD